MKINLRNSFMNFALDPLLLRVIIGCSLLLPCLLFSQSPKASKPILIVTTDIGQDPDDTQSMIRLLHYANDFNLAGLIANADNNYEHELPEIQTDLLHELIDAYGKIYPKLKRVDVNYPSSRDLKKLVKKGCNSNGGKIPVMNYIGAGKNTEGSDWIIKQVDAAEDVVHIAVWGGACDLAQALFDVRNTRSTTKTQEFVSKLRVYFIGQQDSSNPWIIEHFPDMWLVLSSSYDGNSWNSSFRGIFLGGDMQLTSLDWLHKNLIDQHDLGSLYPRKTWTKGGTKNPFEAMKEGDTPSFLFFLNNGLNVSERPDWGGWGGRFRKIDRSFYQDAEDTFYDVSVDKMVTNAKATVFRWRPDIQGDLAARVQWGRGERETINHYPTIKVNKDSLTRPLYISAKQGSGLTLDASESTDADEDKLSFEWMLYPEAGTFSDVTNIVLSGGDGPETTISLPSKGQGSIHLVLRVSDNARYPLVSYKRVIIEVGIEE